MDVLLKHFTNTINTQLGERVGAEVETQFLDRSGMAISLQTSQDILQELVSRCGWRVTARKGNLITGLTTSYGDKILYELGRHNIEISSVPLTLKSLIPHIRGLLDALYRVATSFEAMPFFAPVLKTEEDLLVIPDERDKGWLQLDGRTSINLLSRCSAVQFTLSTHPKEAIEHLNKLGSSIDRFLKDYPQDVLWRQYIRESHAGYKSSRYGGKLIFEDLTDYCRELSLHDVVKSGRLVPFSPSYAPRRTCHGTWFIDPVLQTPEEVDLFLRSVWWYFRLRRYGEILCIEVRPLPRRGDKLLQQQLDFVMQILS